MQIIKPPLGIKAPLLGLGVPLTLAKSLLRNSSNLQPLLHRLSEPLNSTQRIGLSQFLSSKSSNFSPAFASRLLMGWNAEIPDVGIETFELTKEQLNSSYNNNEKGQGSLPSSLFEQIATDIISQPSAKQNITKKAKSQNKSKSHNKQTKSSSRSKKAVAPATLEKFHQSLNEINTESSVNGDEWVAASEALPVVSSSEVLGVNRSPNLSQDIEAEPALAVPHSDVLDADAANTTDVQSSLNAPQADITLGNTTAGEFSDSAPVLEHFPSESEADKPTVLRRKADDAQTVAAQSPPTVPNFRKKVKGQREKEISIPFPFNPSPIPDFSKKSTDSDSITSEFSGSLPILDTINQSSTGDNFTLFRNLADGEQPAITEPPPGVPISIPDRDSYRTAAGSIDIIPHLHMGAVIDDSLAAGGDVAQREKDDPNENRYNSKSIAGEASTASKDTAFDKLPPPKGFAVGGQVTGSDTISNQQVAPSDTVPAMLTPGEFVVNAIDTQKNLNLLKHVNSGGTVAENLISTSVQDIGSSSKPKEAVLTETPTKVDSSVGSSVQRKGTDLELPAALDSLAPASQGLGTGVQSLSTFSPLQSNSFKTETPRVEQRSAHYPSAPLIFQKRTPAADSPSQWSSVEDLLSGDQDTASPDEFASLNFGSVAAKHWNSQASVVSESRGNFVSRMPAPRGFAAGGEVTAPNISTFVQPYTKTIESPALAPNTDDTDSGDLEALAREIYNRLRQRLEVERERHGIYSGRLPW